MTEEDRAKNELLWEVRGLAKGSENVCWTIVAPTEEAAQMEAQARGMLHVIACKPIITDPLAMDDWQRQVLWRLEGLERRVRRQVILAVIIVGLLILHLLMMYALLAS